MNQQAQPYNEEHAAGQAEFLAEAQTPIQILEFAFPSRIYEGFSSRKLSVTKRFLIDSALTRDKDLFVDATLRAFRLNFVGQDHHLRTIQTDVNASVEVLFEGPNETLLEVTADYISLLRDDNSKQRWSTAATAVVTLSTKEASRRD